MKKIKLRILFVAMLIILTGMNSSSSLIICLESDGHMQIELEKKVQRKILSNSTLTNNENLSLSISTSGERNCEDCCDIPILFNYISINFNSQSDSFLKNEFLTNSVLSDFFGILKNHSVKTFNKYNHSDFTLDFIPNSTVLLI